MTEITNISIQGMTLVPEFNQGIYEYYVLNSSTQQFNIYVNTNEFNIEDKASVYQMPNLTNNKISVLGDNSESLSFTVQNDPLDKGLNVFKVRTPYIEYTINMVYSDSKWPIFEHLLRPGMYGGSYVPNYRLLKEIFTCGSGDKDFEGTYDTINIVNEDALNWFNATIEKFTNTGKLDSIVESFIHYSGFVNTNWPDDGDYRYYLPLIEVGVDRPTHLHDGYIPKNNKLYTFPYTALKIIGYGGESELKYENFDNALHFGIISKFFAGASIQLYPLDYEGVLDNYSAGVVGQPLPVFPYTKDQYMNEWNANISTRTQSINAMIQNRKLERIGTVLGGVSGIADTALTTSGLSKVGTTGEKGSSFNPIAVASGLATGVSKLGQTAFNFASGEIQYNQGFAAMAATLKDTEARPSTVANQNASPSIPAVMKDAVVPYVQRVSLRRSFAEKIDDYFSRYGYAVHRVGVPNINSRPAFNFLRCTDAQVDGNIPNEDLLEIKSIMEHGVTFWHTTDVGNYEVNNPAPIR